MRADNTRDESGGRTYRAHHVAIGIVTAVVAGAAVVSGIGRLAGFADLRDTIDGADPWWLGICAAGQTLVFTGYAGVLREAMATDGGATLHVGPSLRLALASFAATQVFAFAGVGGLALVYWALRRAGRDRHDATVVLVGLNTSVYFVFGVIGWGAAAAALILAEAPLSMTVPWLAGFPLVLAMARWFTAPERVERWTAPDANGDGAIGLARRGVAIGVSAAAWARIRIGDPDGRRLLGWAACYWVGDVVSLWAGLHAFGVAPEVAALVAAYTTGYVAQALPIPLIATAGVDAATTFLLHALGVPLEGALLGVVAHRLFAFWIPIVPGSLFAIGLARDGPLGRDAPDPQAEPGAPGSSSQPAR